MGRYWLSKTLEHSKSSLVKEFGLEMLHLEIDDLEQQLTKPGERVGFCHNDLQYGNIMYSENDESITIIVSLFF